MALQRTKQKAYWFMHIHHTILEGCGRTMPEGLTAPASRHQTQAMQASQNSAVTTFKIQPYSNRDSNS
jgi:hypothetical protein